MFPCGLVHCCSVFNNIGNMNEKEISLAHALYKAEIDGGNNKKPHKTHASALQEKIDKGMR